MNNKIYVVKSVHDNTVCKDKTVYNDNFDISGRLFMNHISFIRTKLKSYITLYFT